MRQTIFSLSALALIAGTVVMTEPTLPGHHTAARAETSLIQAAAAGDLASVNSAIKAGADLEARGRNGETALLAATHANQIDVARALIDAGADVNARDAIKDSPYLYAGARGHLEILKMTLAHGADLMGAVLRAHC